MTAALKIITASLCLILLSLALRACAPPPRRPDSEPEYAADEEDPRAEILAELHALRDEMQLNHAEVVFLTMDLDDPSSLDHVDPAIIPYLIKPLAPDTRTPSFCLDWEIRQKWLDPLEHEPSELISGSGRPLNFYLTDNLIMDK